MSARVTPPSRRRVALTNRRGRARTVGGCGVGRVHVVKLVRFFAVSFLVGYLAACGRPEPPTLTPERGEVTSVGPDGIHLVLHMGVKNPNRYDLSARSVTGRVKLAGQYDL